jgi:hypothetical protein
MIDKHKQIAENQRTFCIDLAARFESTDPLALELSERAFVAGLLRFWATTIPDKPKGKQGLAAKFDHTEESIRYVLARREGRTHGEAIKEIVERISAALPPDVDGITYQAVDNVIRAKRDKASAFLDKLGMGAVYQAKGSSKKKPVNNQ